MRAIGRNHPPRRNYIYFLATRIDRDLTVVRARARTSYIPLDTPTSKRGSDYSRRKRQTERNSDGVLNAVQCSEWSLVKRLEHRARGSTNTVHLQRKEMPTIISELFLLVKLYSHLLIAWFGNLNNIFFERKLFTVPKCRDNLFIFDTWEDRSYVYFRACDKFNLISQLEIHTRFLFNAIELLGYVGTRCKIRISIAVRLRPSTVAARSIKRRRLRRRRASSLLSSLCLWYEISVINIKLSPRARAYGS